ncbi:MULTISPECIES: serine hydrolase domain-containing protein [Ramlibacter]|uniref:Beta-lactamase family protein n=1 Tax=Ramlibacter aquaticus TaxID=2780094 RepID=A0ABR9SIB5_9BURK|nr:MULTISPECIES: serine hydrolase domain-containing protein [Ramlibacter]MBE7941924.1 beta-lactamase family protein [Ramlibacter aquaticus]
MARLNPRGLARLRDTLQSHIARGHLPGAVAVVAQGGHVAAFEAMGRRDPAADAAMAPDAIFRIYSMTKPIVSLAALMLAEEGRLQLGDPVAQYLPAFGRQQVGVPEGDGLRMEPPRRPATVHDLLRHTAGLTYEFLGTGAVNKRYAAVDIADRSRTNAAFCEVLASLPLADHPGTVWHYSRATDVLGALLEVVSGQPLGRLLQERILGPLGMRDTAFAVPQAEWARIAEPFATDPDSGAAVRMLEPREVPAFESGGGGLMGTAADYLAFLECLRNGGLHQGQRLVSRKTVEWMTADHLGGIPPVGELLLPGYGFGLGFAVRLQDGLGPQPGSAGQYFWSGIGGTSFFVDPREDLVGILMTQAPGQRIYYRNLFRALVYAALD